MGRRYFDPSIKIDPMTSDAQCHLLMGLDRVTRSQSVRMYTRISSTRSLAGSAEYTTFPTYYEAVVVKCLVESSFNFIM